MPVQDKSALWITRSTQLHSLIFTLWGGAACPQDASCNKSFAAAGADNADMDDIYP